MSDIFDSKFNGMPGVVMYRGWVYPDIYPNERQAVLSNWHDEDIEAFVGRMQSQ